MTNFKGFFDKNPDQLRQLIGDIDPKKFFNGVKKIVEFNSEDDEKPLEPTRKQLIDLIVKLNGDKKGVDKVMPHMQHHMGLICMN
jgi:hypothetical protein